MQEVSAFKSDLNRDSDHFTLCQRVEQLEDVITELKQASSAQTLLQLKDVVSR